MKNTLLMLGLCLLVGCKTSYNKKVFLTELAAASTADACMRGYALYWKAATNNPVAFKRTTDGLVIERQMVEGLSIRVGAAIQLTETLRQTYLTNAVVKPALTASLLSLGSNVSNILDTVNFNITAH